MVIVNFDAPTQWLMIPPCGDSRCPRATVVDASRSDCHSWASLNENLAAEERLSLIANSNLALLNGKALNIRIR